MTHDTIGGILIGIAAVIVATLVISAVSQYYSDKKEWEEYGE